MPRSRIVIAAAGAGKSTWICREAHAGAPERVLLLTYTNANLRRLRELLLAGSSGAMPGHITSMTWFDFLLNHGARPYQRAMTGHPNQLRGLQFDPSSPRSHTIRKSDPAYFVTKRNDLYVDRVSDFVHVVNEKTNGKVVGRWVDTFGHVMVDEVQDMRGYDLEIFDALLGSSISVTLVGDPRQALLRTTLSNKNKRYGGSNLVEWADAHSDLCDQETLAHSYRSVQAICDFADALFPEFQRTISRQQETGEIEGIQVISRDEVDDVFTERRPVVLRHNLNTDTLGLPALNIGVAKGSTHDHVMIFCTGPMEKYVDGRDLDRLKEGTRASLYVAVTRARYSVTSVRQ